MRAAKAARSPSPRTLANLQSSGLAPIGRESAHKSNDTKRCTSSCDRNLRQVEIWRSSFAFDESTPPRASNGRVRPAKDNLNLLKVLMAQDIPGEAVECLSRCSRDAQAQISGIAPGASEGCTRPLKHHLNLPKVLNAAHSHDAGIECLSRCSRDAQVPYGPLFGRAR